MYTTVVFFVPLIVNANEFWLPYVLFAAGAIFVPPFHGPEREEAQKPLSGLARQPVLEEARRK
jgi:hypothetical protein